jgi:hypothetical protein
MRMYKYIFNISSERFLENQSLFKQNLYYNELVCILYFVTYSLTYFNSFVNIFPILSIYE